MDTQIERMPGEPDEAARALAMWASGLTIDQIATRLRRPKVKILSYKQEWKWDERTVRGSAKPVVSPRAVVLDDRDAINRARVEHFASARREVSPADEIAQTIARLERTQDGLKSLQHHQFELGVNIVKKLVHAVERLDDTAIKPRDIGPLLAAATRATESSWETLANMEGITAFLTAAIKTQTPPESADDDEDDE